MAEMDTTSAMALTANEPPPRTASREEGAGEVATTATHIDHPPATTGSAQLQPEHQTTPTLDTKNSLHQLSATGSSSAALVDDEARDVVPALPGDDPLPTMVDNAHDMPIESSTTAATPLPQISITGTGTNFLTQLSERLNRHHHHSHGIHHGAAGSSASLVSSNASTIPTRNPTRQSSFASGASGAATPSHAGAMLEDITVYTQNREDYELDAAAGYGSSAVVYAATFKPAQKRVAIKMLDLDAFERNHIDELRKELLVMTLCKHTNLLSVKASFVVDSKLYIVTPLVAHGSFLDIMKWGFPDGLDETAITIILKQALQGLDYLHKNGLIHRDIKAGNLLLDDDGTVMLADFGVSSSLYDSMDRQGVRKTFVGTPCWIAPEVVQQTGHDTKADIWSFGITALELAHGRAPFAKYPPMKVLMMTLQNEPPTLDRTTAKRKYTRVFKEMIDMCLQKNPARRPTAERLLHHAFFKAAKKKQYLVDMVASLPPISERQQGEPKKEVAPRASGQSWDFSEDNTTEEIDSVDDLGLAAKLAQSRASLVTGSDSQLARSDSKELSPQSSTSVESLDRQPVALAPTSAGPDGTLSPVNGSTAQKKGRFVVDVAATGNKPVVSAATTAQPSNVPTQQPPHMTADLHHIAPLDPSAFRVQVSGNTPPPGAGEVRKGRFSVMGEASKETPAAAGDVAKPKMVAVIADDKERQKKATVSEQPTSAGAPVSESSQRRGRFEVTSSTSTSPLHPVPAPIETSKHTSSVPPSTTAGSSRPGTQQSHSHQWSLQYGQPLPLAMTTMPGQMDARLLEQMVTLFEQQRGLLGDLLSQQQLLHHQHERVASAAGSPSSAASSIAGSFGSTLATMPSSVNIANTMATLQNQVRAFVRENEALREENTRLRARLAIHGAAATAPVHPSAIVSSAAALFVAPAPTDSQPPATRG